MTGIMGWIDKWLARRAFNALLRFACYTDDPLIHDRESDECKAIIKVLDILRSRE